MKLKYIMEQVGTGGNHRPGDTRYPPPPVLRSTDGGMPDVVGHRCQHRLRPTPGHHTRHQDGHGPPPQVDNLIVEPAPLVLPTPLELRLPTRAAGGWLDLAGAVALIEDLPIRSGARPAADTPTHQPQTPGAQPGAEATSNTVTKATILVSDDIGIGGTNSLVAQDSLGAVGAYTSTITPA